MVTHGVGDPSYSDGFIDYNKWCAYVIYGFDWGDSFFRILNSLHGNWLICVLLLEGCKSLSLDQSLKDSLMAFLPGTGMCTFTNVCQNIITLWVLEHIFCLETKNTWARDDPAILVLIGACLCGMFRVFSCLYIQKFIGFQVSAIAWGVVYSYSILEILNIALFMIFRDFLVSGVIIATLLWWLITRFLMSINLSWCRFAANRLLLSPPSHSTSADSRVEWAYAFDVHTNAFFPFYLTLYLAQLFLLPIILKDKWVCLWIGNTLYLAA